MITKKTSDCKKKVGATPAPPPKSASFEISTFKFVKMRSFMLQGKKIIHEPNFGYFWIETWKNFCHIWNHHPRIYQNAKFHVKQKILKFGTKIHYLDTFRPEFGKTFVIFDISNFEFVKMQIFMLKGKNLSLGPKLPYLGVFRLEFEKNVCHIWNKVIVREIYWDHTTHGSCIWIFVFNISTH